MVGYLQTVLHSGVAGEGAVSGRSSQFISFMLQLWSWGLMSPQTMQELAHRALMDFDNALKDEDKAMHIRHDLKMIATLGDKGKYKGNMHRDLERKLEDSWVTSWCCKLPLKPMSAPRWSVNMLAQTMLLPHLLFSCMGNFYPAAFAKLMCPSAARLERFWTFMAGSPQLQGT
jgi:hypothetical protein